jgi:hypothetical protein
VRGSHERDRRPPLSLDGNCGVHSRLKCVLETGDPTVFVPSLSSDSIAVVLAVLPAGAGAPRDFMAPSTCGGLSCQAGPEPASAHLRAWPESRQGSHFPAVIELPPRRRTSHDVRRALLDVRLPRLRRSMSSTISPVNERNNSPDRRECLVHSDQIFSVAAPAPDSGHHRGSGGAQTTLTR